MNASLSDGNEMVIDIFILSTNSPLSTQLEKQLMEEGYYVTLFSDGTQLLETLRNGKPNLLICDTTSADADAFEVCRQIKADDYLWNIPVLILTGASDLGYLLRVLDCNADNFIAAPFDTPYLISLIEGMLITPVERQTAEQVKTQFKIKHDEQVYVVTADRRKLLEFLLSSFEIAVHKSTDLSRAQEDIQNLGFTIRQLEAHIQENTQAMGVLNETLKTREQKLSELTARLSDREQSIQEKNAIIDQVSRELSAEKSAYAEAQEEIQRIVQEKDESIAAHTSSIDQLQRQVSDLSSELATLKPVLERAQVELLSESAQRKDTESELSILAEAKEQTDKAFRALTVESEQLKITLSTEKSRVQEAEQELNAVLLAKTQSEQDLTGIINDLKATATQQAAALIQLREESASERARLQEETEKELARVKEESASERARLQEEAEKELTRVKEESASERARLQEETEKELTRVKEESATERARLQEEMEKELTRVKEESATERARLQEETEKELTRVKEESASERARLQEALESERSQLQLTTGNLNAVTEAKEKSEAWLQATIDAGNQNLLDMQARLDASRSDLEEKDQRIKALSEESATVGSAREAAEQELVSVIRSLAEANIALEGRQKDLLDLHARLDAARSELEEKDQRIKVLSEESATVSSGRESAEQELASVSRALTEAKTALEAETRNSASQKEDLSRVNAERERAEALAASFSESLKESQNRLEQEQGRYRYNEERLNAIIRERERELGELRQAHEDARTAFSSHASSLDQVRLDLDSAVSARTDLEGKLHAAQEKLLRLDQDLRSGSEEKAQVSRQLSSLADELERLRTKLENETTRRQEAEDQFRDALSQQQQLEQDLERFVSESKTLHADLTAERRMLDAAKEQNQALESQVSALSRGKLEAEQTAADLTAEIEQARVALADEWEDHMTDHERLAVPAGKKQPSETAGSPVEAPEPERTRKRSIIVKAPDILPGFSPLISPVTATDTVNASEPETPHIRSVEDLFEDDEDVEEKQSRDPEVSIIQEPATEPVRDVLPDIISDRSEDQESFFEDEKSSGPDFGTITDEDYTDDEVSILEQSDAVPGSGPAITFNRTQWLNLLKW